MKKLIAILTALCVLAAGAAFAEKKVTTTKLPDILLTDENIAPERFYGNWFPYAAVMGGQTVDLDTAGELWGGTLPVFHMEEGKLISEFSLNGEITRREAPLEFNADGGQMTVTAQDSTCVFDLCENGDVLLSVLVPEGDGFREAAALYMMRVTAQNLVRAEVMAQLPGLKDTAEIQTAEPFFGTWTVDRMIAGDEITDGSAAASMWPSAAAAPTFRIDGEKFFVDIPMKDSVQTLEEAYLFVFGQLMIIREDSFFMVELLENDSIIISVMFPNEDGNFVLSGSLLMAKAAE